MRGRAALAWFVLAALGTAAARAQHCMYEIVGAIETPGCGAGGLAPITATAINDEGVVVGYFFDCSFSAKPFMWSQESGFVALPLPSGVSEARAEDINNHGEIVGTLSRPGVGSRAFRYKDGVWTELPPTGSGLASNAEGMNDDGWVAGYRLIGSELEVDQKAILWRSETVQELSSPNRGESARAVDVNEQLITTGTFGGLIFGRAFLWEGDQATVIPPVTGGTSSVGQAIQNDSSVTGYSYIDVEGGDVPISSWAFRNGQHTELGALPRAKHRTIASDANDLGQIVGRSEGVENGTATPFLWQHGNIVDVQPLIVDPPLTLSLETASAINNNGWIVVGSPVVVLAPIDRPPGDVNIDCVVDEFDLIAVLDDWGPDKLGHPTDIVARETFQPPGDGDVDAADLAFVLGNWSTASSKSAPTGR